MDRGRDMCAAVGVLDSQFDPVLFRYRGRDLCAAVGVLDGQFDPVLWTEVGICVLQ